MKRHRWIHPNIDEFKAWALARGWTEEPTKDKCERLRMRFVGSPHSAIFRFRDRSDGLVATGAARSLYEAWALIREGDRRAARIERSTDLDQREIALDLPKRPEG